MYSANYDVITQKSNLILLSFMEFVNKRNKKIEFAKTQIYCCKQAENKQKLCFFGNKRTCFGFIVRCSKTEQQNFLFFLVFL